MNLVSTEVRQVEKCISLIIPGLVVETDLASGNNLSETPGNLKFWFRDGVRVV